MKVECLELKSQKCGFAFVGEVDFDENGIAEIEHEELLSLLAVQKGFRLITEPAPAPKAESKPAQEPVKEKEPAKEPETPKEPKAETTSE